MVVDVSDKLSSTIPNVTNKIENRTNVKITTTTIVFLLLVILGLVFLAESYVLTNLTTIEIVYYN